MKIDITQITGFEKMDDTAKVTALLDYEFEPPEDNSAELTRQLSEVKKDRDKIKSSLDKALSEANKLKKGNEDVYKAAEEVAVGQLADWKAETEAAHRAELEALSDAVKEYQKKERLASFRVSYAEAGITDEKTVKALLAFVENESHSTPEYQNVFAKALAKAYDDKRIQDGQKLPAPGGSAKEPKTRAELLAMGAEKIAEFKRDNPERYKQLLNS